MKKLYILILFTVFLGLHLSSLDISAQSCSQLNLPEHVITRLCMPYNRQADDLDFSPDGKTLASLIDRRQVVLWNIENKTEKLTIDSVKGRSVRYSPDGKTLVCGDVLYDAITGEPKLLLLDGDGYRDYVEYSPDGETLAGAGEKGIRFWKLIIEEATTDALPVGDTPINILPTDPSAVVVDNPKTNPTSVPFATSSTTVPGIRGLSYSPDGTEVAIPCNLGIWIYDAVTNREVTLLNRNLGGHNDVVVSVKYSPDGNTLASAASYGDNRIRVWDAKTKKHKFTMSRTNSFGRGFYYLNTLAFSPKSDILISTNRIGIDLWDPVTGEYKSSLLGHQGNKVNAIFSPDGNTIVTSGGDKIMLLWDFASYPIISISPASVTSLVIGEEITFTLNITNGKNLSGYQAAIKFDPDVLGYIETKYGDYLSDGVPIQPIVNNHSGTIQLASLSLSDTSANGNGTLATIKFTVKSIETSKLALQDVILSDIEGSKSYAWLDGAEILKSITTEDGDIITCSTNNTADVNKDCVINIQDLVLVAINFGKGGENPADVNGDRKVDIIDLVLVAGAFGTTSGAPAVFADTQDMFSASNVQQWLNEARIVNIDDPAFQRGILILEQLLITSSPRETVLLPNYPNPFNPETWIPYQLSKSSDVTFTIYNMRGVVVRELALGHKPAGYYTSKNRAAYWDGRNQLGEKVAAGVYFSTFKAADYTATRKMLIRK